MRFVPVEFDALNCTILKPHRCNAFEFSPTSGAEDLSQTRYLADPAANGDWFDLFDLANQFKFFVGWEFHWGMRNTNSPVK